MAYNSLRTALAFTSIGLPPSILQSCTFIHEAITVSECESNTFPPTIGSIGMQIGSGYVDTWKTDCVQPLFEWFFFRLHRWKYNTAFFNRRVPTTFILPVLVGDSPGNVSALHSSPLGRTRHESYLYTIVSVIFFAQLNRSIMQLSQTSQSRPLLSCQF